MACEWTIAAEVSTPTYSPRWIYQYNATEAMHTRLACGDDSGSMYRFEFGRYVSALFDMPGPSGTTVVESSLVKLP